MTTATAPPLKASQFAYLRDLLYQRSAIVLEPGKEYLAESRLAPIARRHGYASAWDLLARLRTQPYGKVHVEVVEAMTTNETSFFRDAGVFDALVQHALPELVRRRAPMRQLNVWSAACSSGQERYSLGILLQEHFPQLASWRVRILATDLSGEMLARTAEGRYTQLEVNRGLPAPLLVKHFQKQGLDWRVRDHLRGGWKCGLST